MTDSSANTRTYVVPANWSNEPPVVKGFETLDLQALAGQLGEGGATVAAPTDVGDWQIPRFALELHIRAAFIASCTDFHRPTFVHIKLTMFDPVIGPLLRQHDTHPTVLKLSCYLALSFA